MSLSLFQRLVVMLIAVLLLGLLIVATTDGLTVAGGVFGLFCFGLLILTGMVIAYFKAAKSSKDGFGEGLNPVFAIPLLVIVFTGGFFVLLMKMSEEGLEVGDLFPLTKFSVLTVLGPVLVGGCVVIAAAQTYTQNHAESWKAKLSALGNRIGGAD